MATDRDSRAQRVLNVIIAAGVLAVVSAMMVTPRNGPDSWLDVWLTGGLPFLAIGLVGLALTAPRYIRGGERP
jgi:hypothetical protein